jgi:hypothetical protein
MADLCEMWKGEDFLSDKCGGECFRSGNIIRCEKCKAEYPFFDGEPDATCPICTTTAGEDECSIFIKDSNLHLDPRKFPFYGNGFGKLGPFSFRVCPNCGIVFYPFNLCKEDKEDE